MEGSDLEWDKHIAKICHGKKSARYKIGLFLTDKYAFF